MCQVIFDVEYEVTDLVAKPGNFAHPGKSE